MSARAKNYELDTNIDVYGSTINLGELYAIDYQWSDEVIHLENICEWLNEKYSDYEAEMIDDDADFIDYITSKYDLDVYKK